MPTDDDTLIPLVQAAQHLGMAHSAAYSRVRLGRLHAVLVKNKLMVRPSEVERYREEAITRPAYDRHRGRTPEKLTE